MDEAGYCRNPIDGRRHPLPNERPLYWEVPENEPQDSYTNDLNNSIRLEDIPTFCYTGNRLIEIRKDALVCTREVLAVALDIMGKAKTEL